MAYQDDGGLAPGGGPRKGPRSLSGSVNLILWGSIIGGVLLIGLFIVLALIISSH